MVPPNGVSFARSSSTWIHWKSSVASANALTPSWVISCQSLTPSSSPTLAFSSSVPVMVSMGGSLWAPRGSVPDERELAVAAGLRLPLSRVGGGEQLVGRLAVLGEDRRADARGERRV